MPEKVKKCVASWQKLKPEFEIRLWNEDNFNLSETKFTEEAASYKRWAFVSDYVRLKALYEYGGIYLDADVEVIRRFDDGLLDTQKAIISLDGSGYVAVVMLAPPHHPLFGRLVQLYHELDFVKRDGTLNMEVNNTYIQKMLLEYGYERANRFQDLEGNIELYPDEFFNARSLTSGKLNVTENTYTIHWHTTTWANRKTKLIKFVRMKILAPLFGDTIYENLSTKLKKGKSYV